MSSETIDAHSVAEAFLYVLVTPCPICAHGACEPGLPRHVTGESCIRITGTCKNCGGSAEHRFNAPGALEPVDPVTAVGAINPDAEPSQIIDVAQWLTLAGTILLKADETPGVAEQRWLKHRARQCLDEALKFYTNDNELPPAEAMFTRRSRQALRDHPQRFARERILARRAKLPHVTEGET